MVVGASVSCSAILISDTLVKKGFNGSPTVVVEVYSDTSVVVFVSVYAGKCQRISLGCRRGR